MTTPEPDVDPAADLPDRIHSTEDRSRHSRGWWVLLRTLWFVAVGAYCCLPLLPNKILVTQASDLTNHVRHVYEYGLSLRERQIPPLVAPSLNGGMRIPLFQYYTGTGYLVPGIFSALGIDPYNAIKLSIVLHITVAGMAIYGFCRLLGARRSAAFVAATAFQLFPFAGTNLLNRGGYPEVTAMYAAPLVFYALLRAVHSQGRNQTIHRLCLAGLAWAYFIPIHPIQAVLSGALILILASVHTMFDQPGLRLRQRGQAVAKLLATFVIGMVGAAWFWWPIARDYGALRIVPHETFLDTGLANLSVLLWPGFRETFNTPGWAPQLGVHFAIAGVIAAVWFRRTRFVGVAAALSLAAIVFVIGWHEQFPWIASLFKPLQWSYRLLMPAALAGTICIAVVLNAMRCDRRRGVLVGLVLGYVLALSVPYFLSQGKRYELTTEFVTSQNFVSANADYYALRGTDFRRLGLCDAANWLVVEQDLAVPPEGYPTEVQLVLRRPEVAADIDVLTDGARNPSVTKALEGETLHISFSIVPKVGLSRAGHSVLRFETSGAATPWQVLDLTFRVQGDDSEQVVRLPDRVELIKPGANSTWRIYVAPGKAGLYQLPFCNLPGNRLRVNGLDISPTSADRFMTIVPLKVGNNQVRLYTRPSVAAGPALGMIGILVLGSCGIGSVVRLPHHRSHHLARSEAFDPVT